MISPELEKMAASDDYKGIAFCKVDVVSFETFGRRTWNWRTALPGHKEPSADVRRR
jgi:hypothetical protein